MLKTEIPLLGERLLLCVNAAAAFAAAAAAAAIPAAIAAIAAAAGCTAEHEDFDVLPGEAVR